MNLSTRCRLRHPIHLILELQQLSHKHEINIQRSFKVLCIAHLRCIAAKPIHIRRKSSSRHFRPFRNRQTRESNWMNDHNFDANLHFHFHFTYKSASPLRFKWLRDKNQNKKQNSRTQSKCRCWLENSWTQTESSSTPYSTPSPEIVKSGLWMPHIVHVCVNIARRNERVRGDGSFGVLRMGKLTKDLASSVVRRTHEGSSSSSAGENEREQSFGFSAEGIWWAKWMNIQLMCGVWLLRTLCFAQNQKWTVRAFGVFRIWRSVVMVFGVV